MKRILGILLALCFLMSVTAVAVSARSTDHADSGRYMNSGYHWYNNHWYSDDYYHSHKMHYDNENDKFYHMNYHWWKGSWQDDHYKDNRD